MRESVTPDRWRSAWKARSSDSIGDRSRPEPLRDLLAFSPDIAFAACAVIAARVRWEVLASNLEPPGVDGGNWLALGHQLMGSTALPSSILYPPIVPLLSLLFASIWGPMLGTSLLATVASTAPGIGAYVLLRSLRWRAVALAGFLLTAASTGEAAAWGGYPQLFALGFLLASLWAANQFGRTFRLRWAWIAAALVLAAVATNDLVGPMALASAVILVLARSALSDIPRSRRTLIEGIALLVVPSLALSPIYFALIQGVTDNSATASSAQHLSGTGLEPSLLSLFREAPALWQTMLVIGLLSPALLNLKVGRNLGMVSTAILAPTVVITLVLRDVRALYFLPIVAVVGVAAWWEALTAMATPITVRLDRLLMVAAVPILLLQSSQGLASFHTQVEWYTAISPGVVQGLEQLNRIAPAHAVLAVSPAGDRVAGEDGWPLGRWVEGLLDRPTYYASSLQWLNYADERSRAEVANAIFSPQVGIAGASRLARQHNIDYLIADRAWPGYVAWAPAGQSPPAGVVVIDTPSLLVFQTDG